MLFRSVNDKQVQGGGFDKIKIPKRAFAMRPEGEMDFANLFVRELK